MSWHANFEFGGAAQSWSTRSDFQSDEAYGRYVAATVRPGMRVRITKAFEAVQAGDTGKYLTTNGGRPPCKVQWDRIGTAFWVKWWAPPELQFNIPAWVLCSWCADFEFRGTHREDIEIIEPAKAVADGDEVCVVCMLLVCKVQCVRMCMRRVCVSSWIVCVCVSCGLCVAAAAGGRAAAGQPGR